MRIIYTAEVVGGELAVQEVDGTTDHAAWIPLTRLLADGSRAEVLDVALAAAGLSEG